MDADEVMNSSGPGGEEDLDELNEIDETQADVQTEEEPAHQSTPSNLSASSKLKRLFEYHPECILDYMETVIPRLQIKGGEIQDNEDRFATDENHKTYPFLTLYERTSIIGLRSEMLSNGAQAYIVVPDYITDVKEIARLELEQKRLPFIVKRPLPNGQYEYWRLADLMLI
jgi:DNA-directed RNA polymerase I, II, and III subunit RPABC2